MSKDISDFLLQKDIKKLRGAKTFKELVEATKGTYSDAVVREKKIRKRTRILENRIASGTNLTKQQRYMKNKWSKPTGVQKYIRSATTVGGAALRKVLGSSVGRAAIGGGAVGAALWALSPKNVGAGSDVPGTKQKEYNWNKKDIKGKR